MPDHVRQRVANGSSNERIEGTAVSHVNRGIARGGHPGPSFQSHDGNYTRISVLRASACCHTFASGSWLCYSIERTPAQEVTQL
jgi:hypothetical protein